jgi:hypothetical protein
LKVWGQGLFNWTDGNSPVHRCTHLGGGMKGE